MNNDFSKVIEETLNPLQLEVLSNLRLVASIYSPNIVEFHKNFFLNIIKPYFFPKSSLYHEKSAFVKVFTVYCFEMHGELNHFAFRSLYFYHFVGLA